MSGKEVSASGWSWRSEPLSSLRMVSSALATLVSLPGPGAGGLAVTSEAVLPNPTQRGQGSTTSPLELQTHSFKCCPLKSLLATRETTILPNQRYRHAVSPAFSFLSSFPPVLQTVHNCLVTVPKPVTPSLSHAADCHQLLPSTRNLKVGRTQRVHLVHLMHTPH